jgi:hypothetical protein
MEKNFDFDRSHYRDEDDEFESHYMHEKQHRSRDARRKIEIRSEKRRLREMLDYDDYSDLE